MLSQLVKGLVEGRPFGIASVSEFGAKGDGVADDASAIQAAIDEIRSKGGGVVYLPPGTYALGNTVTIPGLVNLIGAGIATTLTRNGPILQITGHRTVVRSLRMRGQDSASSCLTLTEGATECIIEHIIITGQWADAIRIQDGAYLNQFRHIIIAPDSIGSIINGVHTVSPNGVNNPNGQVFTLVDTNNCKIGFLFEHGDGHVLIGGNIGYTAGLSGSKGIEIRTRANIILNPWIEDVPTQVELVAPNAVRNVIIVSAGGATPGITGTLAGNLIIAPESPAVRSAQHYFDQVLRIGNANATYRFELSGSDFLLVREGAASQLKVSQNKLLIQGALGVGNALPATTLGSVVKKIEVFDASGVSIGFIPVYNTIT